jgi:hypothetical protein
MILHADKYMPLAKLREHVSLLNQWHWLRNPEGTPREIHPIEALFEAGFTLRSASVEKTDDQDDDWITIELGPDPAIMRYQLPNELGKSRQVDDDMLGQPDRETGA